VTDPIFDAAHRGALLRPGAQHDTVLRDVDILRESLTGSGILAFCDLPWAPIFLVACFLLHPWFGAMALVGGGLILGLTLLNEVATRHALESASRVSRPAGQQAGAEREGPAPAVLGHHMALDHLRRGLETGVLAKERVEDHVPMAAGDIGRRPMRVEKSEVDLRDEPQRRCACGTHDRGQRQAGGGRCKQRAPPHGRFPHVADCIIGAPEE
jgi:hypothetical protein